MALENLFVLNEASCPPLVLRLLIRVLDAGLAVGSSQAFMMSFGIVCADTFC